MHNTNGQPLWHVLFVRFDIIRAASSKKQNGSPATGELKRLYAILYENGRERRFRYFIGSQLTRSRIL